VKALEEALDALDLPEVQREQLKARYVYYTGWLERNATGSRRGHYYLRLTAAVGSVFVASMSSAQVLGSSTPRVVSWILLGTSLAIGVALAIDGFLNLGDRWRHYRAAAGVRAGYSSSGSTSTPISATPTPPGRSPATLKS
jgi:hypothetical protein